MTLTGTSWDPAKNVVVRGYAGADTSAPATSDPKVVVEADRQRWVHGDLRGHRPRHRDDRGHPGERPGRLTASYTFSGQIGTAPVDPLDPASTRSPARSTPGAVTPGTVEPVTPPVEPIPPPEDIPITEPDDDRPRADAEVTEELAVTEVRLDGNATLGELFGGAVRRDLVFLVTNVGETTVENPIVRVSVGRSEDLEPEIVDVEVGVLDPNEQTVVTVPLELPMAAFGTYQVVGQVGDSELGAFELEWTTYPWGLFALNVLGLAPDRLGRAPPPGGAPPGAVPPGGRGQRRRRRRRPGRRGGLVGLPLSRRRAADALAAPLLHLSRRSRPTPSSTSRRRRSGGRAVRRTSLLRHLNIVYCVMKSSEGDGVTRVVSRNRRTWRDRSVVLRLGAVAGCAALALAGCGTMMPGGNTTGEDLTTAAAAGPGPGVTDDSVKVVFVAVDLDAVKKLTGFNTASVGDQEAQVQALEDWVNDNGGIDGRKLDAVFRLYDAADRLAGRRGAAVQPDHPGRQGVRGRHDRSVPDQRPTLLRRAPDAGARRVALRDGPGVLRASYAPYLWTASFPEYDSFVPLLREGARRAAVLRG